MASITSGHELRKFQILVIAVSFTILALTAVVGRISARFIKKQQIDSSDYLIIIALVGDTLTYIIQDNALMKSTNCGIYSFSRYV